MQTNSVATCKPSASSFDPARTATKKGAPSFRVLCERACPERSRRGREKCGNKMREQNADKMRENAGENAGRKMLENAKCERKMRTENAGTDGTYPKQIGPPRGGPSGSD